MNESLKRRLVGAVVLVALGVIFIPFLLDGSRGPDDTAAGSNVPPRPDYRFETIEIPLEVPVRQPEKERRAVETPQEAAVPAPKMVEPEPPPPSAGPVRKVEVPPTTPTAPPGWVVQVASFTQSDNAFGLRDKLRAKGFAAFVEEVTSDAKKVYRVRVGPELSRESAQQLQTRIAEAVSLKGLVMQHP